MRIEARGLGRRFGAVRALRDLTFEIPSGRRLALIGPNGSGKSTLNRILMGLIGFEGEARLDGCSPLAERARVARRMAYVPQIPPQTAVPVAELLAAVVRVRGIPAADVEEVAGALGLDLAALADRPFRGLSGGMKQKLLIALALGSRASLLILDEPTGSLDAASRERFFEIFDGLADRATVVLCSHRLEEVRLLVDHVLALADGRLAWDGPAAAFLAASTRSLIEVAAACEAAGPWLEARGFRKGAGNRWHRTLPPAEKLRLLPELASQLGGRLSDLNVRDLESLEPGPARFDGGP